MITHQATGKGLLGSNPPCNPRGWVLVSQVFDTHDCHASVIIARVTKFGIVTYRGQLMNFRVWPLTHARGVAPKNPDFWNISYSHECRATKYDTVTYQGHAIYMHCTPYPILKERGPHSQSFSFQLYSRVFPYLSGYWQQPGIISILMQGGGVKRQGTDCLKATVWWVFYQFYQKFLTIISHTLTR